MNLRSTVLIAAILAFPLQVGNANDAIDFATEIVPVLTRYGCNSGACHGAAAGRGGFHLSLLGGDANADYLAIVRQFEGRRVNIAHPDRSLILAKPTGDLDHGGDVLFAPDSPPAELLRQWIDSGALQGQDRSLISIDVTPKRYVTEMHSPTVKLQAVAHFQKGDQVVTRDVTPWTVFTVTDPSAVTIDDNYHATIHRRGMHVVLTRFLDRVQPISLAIPFSDPDETDKKAYNSFSQSNNFIDDDVNRLLGQLRLPVSPPAADAMWFRRATLDLTGRLPTPEEALAYRESRSPDKRSIAIDQLISSEGFIDYWTLRFARLFHLHSLPNETAGTIAFTKWIRQCVEEDVGFDQVASQLLTADGDSHTVGPANFARMVPDARSHAELVGRSLLGIRIGCANCHNHPLDRWIQDDYHGLAAIFAPLDRGRLVSMSPRGAVTNPRSGQPATPRIPGNRDLDRNVHDHRNELAVWLVEDERKGFAKAMVNRLWHSMFGRGLVDPPDDIRDTNPATHPDLLDRLADDFIDGGYSIRRTLQRIALSETYGRGPAIADNEIDTQFYSHQNPRPLLPEVMADAIADVTGVVNRFQGQDSSVRAVTIVDPLVPSTSLDILGRCNRLAACNESQTDSPGLAADLHKINGPLMNEKIIASNGWLHRMIAAGTSNEEIISTFYQLAFGNAPSTAEAQRWQERVESDNPKMREQKLEDFVWAVLNSRAFSYNH